MAYIETIDQPEPGSRLAAIYVAAVRRAGRVYNILRIQSQNPAVLQGMLDLYTSAVRGESPLSRAQREMLAVVVSRANRCHY